MDFMKLFIFNYNITPILQLSQHISHSVRKHHIWLISSVVLPGNFSISEDIPHLCVRTATTTTTIDYSILENPKFET